MLREALLALLLATVGLAGCLTPPGEGDPTPTAAAASATRAAGGAEDWHVLNATATPDGALTGFHWVVPEGAVVPDELAEEFFGEDATAVALEFALLLPAGEEDALTEWTLSAFAKDDGELFPLGRVTATPFEVAGMGLAMGFEADEVSTDPFFMRFGFDSLEANETVAFVFGARAAEPTPVQLAFRALPEDPAFDDEPSEDAAAFLRAVDGRAAVEVVPTGAGAGFQAALFVEFGSTFLLPFAIEMWTEAVEREGGAFPDARPFASVREQGLSASYESASGYAEAFGVYWGDIAAGEWSVEADMRGETLAAGGPVLATYGAPGYFLLGMPVYGALSDGGGPSESRLRLSVASANAGGIELLLFEQFDLGADLTTLVGDESYSDAFVWKGLLGATGRTAVVPHGTDLHLVGLDGATRTYVGAMPER